MQVNHYSGNTLNRQSARRSDTDDLRKERKQSGRFVAFDELKFLAKPDGRVAWLSHADLLPELSDDADLDGRAAYLGLDEDVERPYWAVDVTGMSALSKRLAERGSFLEARPASLLLPRFESSLVALGRSITDWHTRYKFCPSCASPTKLAEAGYKRVCSNTSCTSHSSVQNYSYPRTDPVVIIAVSSADGQRLLLGRQKRWPPGLFSCIAGFVECAESLEEACMREVYEESGVRLGNVRYHSSQPWPFPSQLMLGCLGEASNEQVTLHDKELEDAQWFSREEVKLALAGTSTKLKIPPSTAIAHTLIRAWADGTPKSSLQNKM
ncbi:NUDIX hydrolase domain-like protein [Entophlyctis helioformis]|nr:NUDIX hydrolase domain-like protein [Entophlyctis helioformis]